MNNTMTQKFHALRLMSSRVLLNQSPRTSEFWIKNQGVHTYLAIEDKV